MIRKSIIIGPPVFLMRKDKRKCICIGDFIIAQCVVMFVASITVLYCLWSPDRASFDYYKLASIMYLYDKKACGYGLVAKSIANLQLSNDTRGLNVLPIKCMPAVVTVSTRLSTKTRNYVKASIGIHVAWMILAIGLRIISKNNKSPRLLKFILAGFFYASIFVISFDLSMAIVYVAHIRQSLTKGMIVRHSGWNVLLKLENPDDFAGWLPIIASVSWVRGIFIFGLNIYCCKIIQRIRNKIQKREFRARLNRAGNLPLPEPTRDHVMEDNVLYYRPGEPRPYVNKHTRIF